MDFPMFESDLYLMREMTFEDAKDIFEYYSNRNLMKYMSTPTHHTLEETKAMVRKLCSSFSQGKGVAWVIVDKEQNKAIGNIGLYYLDDTKQKAGVGYIVRTEYQNRGIATWALRNSLSCAFDHLKVNQVEAKYKSVNLASERVMIKAGMLYKEINKSPFLVDGIYYDIVTYSLSREDLC